MVWYGSVIPFINFHTQLFFCHLQLVVIVGLTKDEGKSTLGRLCRSKFVQFLGDYSMATYMLHDSVIKIVTLHVQLEQVITCLLSTTNKYIILAGPRNNPNLLHIPDIPFKHPGLTSYREADI